MTDRGNDQATAETQTQETPRERAIRAYEDARGRATDTLGQAPLIALAGGLAAGALIANAAFKAARTTGTQRLGELGISREKGEETIRSLIEGITDAAKASASAAAEAVRKQG